MPNRITGRCYCGKTRIDAADPQISTYCHCGDCKRWTGAPAPAFVAFDEASLEMTPRPVAKCFSIGVSRWNCAECGSPLAASFDYLPGQIYVPLGILEDAETVAPKMHVHAESELSWLHLKDGLPRTTSSGKEALIARAKQT